jgi:hypothetical protein
MTAGSSEDQNADRNVDSKDCPLKVSDGKEYFIGNWTGRYSSYVLLKNLFIFCPCPETSKEVAFKNNEVAEAVGSSL